MNLLEYYIQKVKKIEEIPAKEVDMSGFKCFEDKSIVIVPKHYEVTYKVNCCGTEQDYVKTYMTKEEIHKDLERGYFLA